MPQFKQGDAVRTKSGGGPNMTVDGYTITDEVICTFWVKNRRQQEHFIEATLELVPSDQIRRKVSLGWLGKKRGE